MSYNNVTKTDQLQDKVLMQLPNRQSEKVIDVFVFDKMVAVRTWGGEDELLFFMKPLSEGAFARRLELNKS